MKGGICALRVANCTCYDAWGHDGPHRCACGGSWTETDGVFDIVALPFIFRDGSYAL